MKNEQKIIELLAELIRKREQDEERIRQNEELLKQHAERLNHLDDIAAGTLTLLRDLAKRSGETDELRDRIQRLKRHTGLS